MDPDLGWHLQVGRNIAQAGQLPTVNYYNYTYTGNWVDHEWLANYLMFKTYSHFGYMILNVIFSVLVLLTLILMLVFARRQVPALKSATALTAGLIFFGLIGSLPHMGIRIQEVALLFSLLVLVIINQYERRGNFGWLVLLVPILYLWACLHASFLFGLVMVFAWVGLKILEKILVCFRLPVWLDLSQTVDWRKISIFIGFGLTTLGATMLTPYRFSLYSFLFGYRNTFYMWHIQEWLPQYFFPFNYWQLGYLGLAAAIFGIYVYEVFKNKQRRLKLWPVFLFIFLLAAALQSHRNFPLFFVVSFSFLAEMFAALAPKINFDKIGIKTWLADCLILCLFFLTVSQALKIIPVNNPFLSFPDIYPQGAVNFLKSNPQYNNANIFNEYVWGGYLIWMDPDRKLFIDGRLPQEELNSHSFLEEYLSFFRADSNETNKLALYNVRLVLLKAEDKDIKARPWEKFIFGIKDNELKTNNQLRVYLNASSDWIKVYQDQTAVIYYKTK